ncbi:FAD-binding oxidoreductase [Rhodocyclus tenuis]|uniref:FAD-binding oxidoreductase n=1 Tax=Rhodocyclus gracilis TaxID=2929842 RepID=A0ABX0WFF1_9RHOO|nr:FAD-binding oxidoreductase [Rhodocyclus gracilis]NJA88100.1 FAD-binding oxidoreductase [Rhodocyclus gracilis]
MALNSWGRLPSLPAAQEIPWRQRDDALPELPIPLLAFGNGRSYGDSCLNSDGALLLTRGTDRFISFDAAPTTRGNPTPATPATHPTPAHTQVTATDGDSAYLRCEAGVLLADIIEVFLPRGWFLPVTPGTRFVTVGGAIANDVHGKNHHRAGSFGAHVRSFELLRSDGSRRVCSRHENADWFAATIGGLGLTGLITWAEIELRRVDSDGLTVENTRFHGLDEFFALNGEAEAAHEYAVAWIDCLAKTPRGIFMAADHAPAGSRARTPGKAKRAPFTPPLSPVNTASLSLFNLAYYHRPLPSRGLTHLLPFFYPLDGVLDWNRLYGRRGFYQYQCVVPLAARAAIDEMLRAIAASGQGSLLAVLKTFGHDASPGMLSFPMEGTTLALDFPDQGEATQALFGRLDAIVAAAGGRLYPAKDARMPAYLFRQGYPQFDAFGRFVDPRFSSNFWRRISA